MEINKKEWIMKNKKTDNKQRRTDKQILYTMIFITGGIIGIIIHAYITNTLFVK